MRWSRQENERAGTAVTAIALNAAKERVERQVVHHLGERELSGIHAFGVPTEAGGAGTMIGRSDRYGRSY